MAARPSLVDRDAREAAISGRSAFRAFLSEPAWQTFNAWIPLYMMTERHMNLKEIALFAWMPFLAADIGCVLGGYLSPLFHKIREGLAVHVAQDGVRVRRTVHGRAGLRRPGGQPLCGYCAAVRRRLRPSDLVGRAVCDYVRRVRQERSRDRHRHGRHGRLPGRCGFHRCCSACWSRRSATARCLSCSRCSTCWRRSSCGPWSREGGPRPPAQVAPAARRVQS